jgi:integrase/recombinase XerD
MEKVCPLRCRITFLGERYEFATGMFVKPSHWFGKQQQAKPPDDENAILNNKVSLIKSKINQAFLFLQMNGGDCDVN